MKIHIAKTHIIAIVAATVVGAGLAGAMEDDQPAAAAAASAQITSDDADRSVTLFVKTPKPPSPPSHPHDTAAVATAVARLDNQIAVSTDPIQSGSTIVINSVEPGDKKHHTKDVAWLGLAVEESSEVLSSQLGLKAGEGLIVTMVAEGSPAEKAEFHKNDVLVGLDGQMLVHPIQLRKLVQMHAQGDPVEVTFFRGGKKQTITVKLGQTKWDEAADVHEYQDDLQNLELQLKGLDGQMHGLDGQMRVLDKARLSRDINHTMEQTRKAIEDSVRRATSSKQALKGAERVLESVARGGVDVDKDATVIVRDKKNSSRTMVQTDDTGSYVIEAGAKTRLTARGKDGKLLFEGEIDTPEQRAKVPKEVWEKVEPMLDEVAAPAEKATPAEPKKP